jgi:hypothetical protein
MRLSNVLIFCVAFLAITARFAFAEEEKRGPKITDSVFFDIEIDSVPAGMCSLDMHAYAR